MATKVINFNQLPDELNKMIRNITKEVGKTKSKTTKQAGQFMIKTAKGFAPYKSGDTKEGIRGHKEGTKYAVTSTVPNGAFKQNVWADNRPVGSKTNRTYIFHQKTGISGGGFFTKAEARTAEFFEDIVVKDVSKWELIR